MALESRGFGGSGVRTDYIELKMRWQDLSVLALLPAAVGAALWWRLGGHGAVLPRV